MTVVSKLSLSPFSLDPEQKEHLIEVIEKLLKDKSTVSTAHSLTITRYLTLTVSPTSEYQDHWRAPQSSSFPSQPSIPQLIQQCHGLLTPT